MPLLFFIDKDFLDDPACRGVDDVVLSYTFFRCVSALFGDVGARRANRSFWSGWLFCGSIGHAGTREDT